MSDVSKVKELREVPREVFTIDEFCSAHGISRAHYFNLRRRSEGPRVMQAGKRTLISREAAADWRRQCEGVQAA